MEATLRADAWFSVAVACRPRGEATAGEPPRAVVAALLAQLQQRLNDAQLAPVGLACTIWHDGDERCATIALLCEAGHIVRPLTSWFWQHPRWQWASAPPLLADPAADARLVESAPA